MLFLAYSVHFHDKLTQRDAVSGLWTCCTEEKPEAKEAYELPRQSDCGQRGSF